MYINCFLTTKPKDTSRAFQTAKLRIIPDRKCFASLHLTYFIYPSMFFGTTFVNGQ